MASGRARARTAGRILRCASFILILFKNNRLKCSAIPATVQCGPKCGPEATINNLSYREFSTWKMSTDQIPVDISVDSCSGSVDIWLAPSGQVSTEIQDME